jgi:hypothetical protein
VWFGFDGSQECFFFFARRLGASFVRKTSLKQIPMAFSTGQQRSTGGVVGTHRTKTPRFAVATPHPMQNAAGIFDRLPRAPARVSGFLELAPLVRPKRQKVNFLKNP